MIYHWKNHNHFKQELIQNAEDAGASEMKILYDDRPAVQEPSTKRAPFRKYFKVNLASILNMISKTKGNKSGSYPLNVLVFSSLGNIWFINITKTSSFKVIDVGISLKLNYFFNKRGGGIDMRKSTNRSITTLSNSLS